MTSQVDFAVEPDRSIETMADLLEQRAAAEAEQTAIVYEGRQTSFSQLAEQSNHVACALLGEGVGSGARVCYLGKNDPRFFELLFGCARANVVLTPVNWRLTPPEIAFIVKDTEAELLFVTRDYLATARAAVGNTPPLNRMIVLDDEGDVADGHAGAQGYVEWLDAHPPVDLSCRSDPDCVVLQIYTSGTTARPKGAQLSNRNLLAAVSHVFTGELGRWSADDLLLMPLPLFHAGGLVCALYAISLGATLILMRDTDIEGIVSAFSEYPVTKMGLVPALLAMMLDAAECASADFRGLDLILYGGSPITQDLLQRSLERFDCPFTQLYGMSEATISVSALSYDRSDRNAKRLESAGRILSGTQVRIVDPDGNDLPLGQIGEVVIKSPTIMSGYWKLPDQTAEVLSDGWYRSGDMGHLDPDQFLFLHDRARDLIISGGENVYPIEVENALAQHPHVADVAVIGVPDPKWGEAVKAFVVLRPGVAADSAALIEFARERIAAYKCPRSIDFAEALPRNTVGKILKKDLRRPYWGDGRQIN